MTLTVSGTLAILVALVMLGLGWPHQAAAATVQYTNTSTITLPASGNSIPYPSAITIAGAPGNITKVTVTLLGFEHQFTPEPRLLLVGPNGITNVFFMAGVGNAAVASPGINLTFDDAAASPPPCFPVGPLVAGTFQPTACGVAQMFGAPAPSPPYGATLSVFNGQSPNGTWSLYGTDPSAPDGGVINNGWSLTITTDAPLGARVAAASGTRYEGGAVHLEWRTSEEVDHLGFRVYRDVGQGPEVVTPGLVAGSALQQGGVALSTDLSYGWWDQLDASTGAVQYWLEAVDLMGQGTWHGPIVPRMESGPSPDVQRARLLAEVGRATSRQRHAVAATSRGRPPWREAADLARQRSLAAQPAVKIAIREHGWYRVTYEHLVGAGFDPAVDPASLRLFLHGREQALQVHGAVPGRFGPGDALEFYGQGQDKPNTDQYIYWLVAGGRGSRRVPVLERPAEPGGAPSYAAVLTWRPRTVYFAGLKNGDAENFFGPPVQGTPLVHPLVLTGVAPEANGGAELTVALQGVSQIPGHAVQVTLNGAVLGTVTFDGQMRQEASFPVAQTALQEGENTLVLQALGGSTDVSLVDVVELRHWRTYTAEGDALHAYVDRAVGVQTLDGFTSPDIRVFDITAPSRVQELVGSVAASGDGYAVSVALAGWGSRSLLAVTEPQIKTPAALVTNVPSRWHATRQGADLLIVTHGAFAEAAQTLRAQRQAEGLTVAVVDIADIYDEWSFGEPSPQALRGFVQHVWTTWQPQPRFVLLVGDTTYDPQDYLATGMPDYVPTKLVDTALMETASDDWFVDFNDDGLPELAIGRLPVRTADAARRVVDKLLSYARQETGTAGPRALLVADVPDVYDFEAVSTRVRAQLPSSMAVTEVRRRETGDTAAQQTIVEHLNAGATLVTYSGHGAYQFWRGDLLTVAAAADLTNRERLSVVVAMACLNGYFQDPARESLAEALLLADGGGAVVVWTSSGMTYAPGQAALLEAWTGVLFAGGAGDQSPTLGEAAVQAKAATDDRDVRRTWNFFGDPSMRLVK